MRKKKLITVFSVVLIMFCAWLFLKESTPIFEVYRIHEKEFPVYRIHEIEFAVNKLFKITPEEFEDNFKISQVEINGVKLFLIEDMVLGTQYSYCYFAHEGIKKFLFAPLYFRNRQFKDSDFRTGVNLIVDKECFSLLAKKMGIEKDTAAILNLFTEYLGKAQGDSEIVKIENIEELINIGVKYKNYGLIDETNLDEIRETYKMVDFENENIFWIRFFGLVNLKIMNEGVIQIVDLGETGFETIKI